MKSLTTLVAKFSIADVCGDPGVSFGIMGFYNSTTAISFKFSSYTTHPHRNYLRDFLYKIIVSYDFN